MTKTSDKRNLRRQVVFNGFTASDLRVQGRSQDFSKGGGGGGHTVSNIIVMAFSPRNILGCSLKKGLQRGVTGTPGPPLATPLESVVYHF